MTEHYKYLSGYQIMWVWVMFDLPTGTRSERKKATRFRNDLLDLGFEMVQFSVYLRYAWSREKAEVYAQQVGECVPTVGKVQILFFTDKQYGMSQIFRNGSGANSPSQKPRQYTLF